MFPVTLVNSTFSSCSAEYGGAVFLDQATALVDECTFHANRADEHAGAIRNNYGNLTVRNSNFTDNSAYFGAGAVGSLHAELADIRGSTFTGNSADTWKLGSAVLSYYTRTVLNFCRIINNAHVDVYCEAGEGIDARYNWWGSNVPDFTELTASDVICNPWLVLKMRVDPSTVTVGGKPVVTVSLREDSEGGIHHTGFSLPVNFSSSAGVLDDALMVNGTASSVLRNLNSPGRVLITAVVDNQMVNTTVNVLAAPVTGISVGQLTAAAAWVNKYYGRYRQLPSYLTIQARRYTMAQFLDLLTRGTIQLNSGTLNPLKPRSVGYAGSTGISGSGRLYRAAYVSVASGIKGFIDRTGRAPRYATTGHGRLSFISIVLGYSRIIDFYGRNGRLPAYLVL